MSKEVLERRGIWSIIKETLSDGSEVYDVVGGNVRFFASDNTEAIEIFTAISAKSCRIEPETVKTGEALEEVQEAYRIVLRKCIDMKEGK